MRRTDKFNANSAELRETREKLSRTDAFAWQVMARIRTQHVIIIFRV